MIEKKFQLHCDSLTKDDKLYEYEQFLKFNGVRHLTNHNGMTPEQTELHSFIRQRESRTSK